MLNQALQHYFKKRKVSDYQYHIIANTPLVHDASRLWELYHLAHTRFQKSCVMQHLVRHDRMLQFSDYRKLYETLYDELSK